MPVRSARYACEANRQTASARFADRRQELDRHAEAVAIIGFLMFRLVVMDPRGSRSVPLDKAPFTIGRSSESQLQLTDAHVSRKHAELTRGGSVWRVRDCGSRYGTLLNGNRVDESALAVGDRLRVGQTELLFESDATSGLISGVVDFRHMNALLTSLRAMGSFRVLDEVLAIVVDSALDVSGAERGFLLLLDDAGGLQQRVARARGRLSIDDAQISQRIPESVLATGADRVVKDLLDDAQGGLHAGTLALGIRHVFCTPLRSLQVGERGEERRIGVLYLDSREPSYLDAVATLHALASEASVVIENARLYQQVLERERLAQELRIAAEMQRALLPPASHADDWVELAAMTTPCREVGGDLFDYVVGPDGVTFLVADVAGKGTSAALLTAVVQGLFAAEAIRADTPVAIVARMNAALCRRAVASRFVTAFCGHVSHDGTLSYCNAGHNPPLLASPEGLIPLDVGGTVMGLFDTARYEMATAQLEADGALVVYSDGVTEAVDPAGEEFGDARLQASLDGARRTNAQDLLTHIHNVLTTFCGGAAARDDVTVFVVKRR